MSTYSPPHELLASDEYWGELSELPKVPLAHHLIDGMTGSHNLASWGAVKVQGMYARIARNGHITTPIEPGDSLPLIERGEGLLRIVQDTRQAPMSDSKILQFIQRNVVDDEPEAFDTKAINMLSNRLYSGNCARMTFLQDSMRIWRSVYYLTGSKSGSQLEGIESDKMFSPAREFAMNPIIPPLVVGESYKRNKAGSVAIKVVAAEVLLRGGKKAKAPKKAKTGVVPGYSFN